MVSTAVDQSARAAATAERVRPAWRDGLDHFLLYGSFAAAMWFTFASSVDDPFITLRYAYNLLHGHGPVFDPGQRVNGATSPVGLLLAVVALAIPGGYAFLKLKLLSLVFGVMTLVAARRLIDTFDFPGWGRSTALVLVGSSAPLAFASASGLETTACVFAVTALLVELRLGRAFDRPLRAALLSALAVAARPEAALTVALLGVAALAMEREWPLRSRAAWLLGAMAAAVSIGLFNWLYYATPLPNTFYAKDVTLSHALPQGAHYMESAFRIAPSSVLTPGVYTLALISLPIGLALLGVGWATALARPRHLGYVAIVPFAQAAFILKSGGDWMHGYRFLAPAVVGIAVLQASGAVTVASAARRWTRAGPFAAVFSAALIIPLCNTYGVPWQHDSVTALAGGLSDKNLIAAGGYRGFSPLWTYIGDQLACARPGDLVATSEAGYVTFSHPALDFMDLRGLTNTQIPRAAPAALRQVVGVTDVDWWRATSPVGRVLLGAQPVLIVTIDGSPPTTVLDAEYRLRTVIEVRQVKDYVYGRVGSSCAP